MIEGVPRGEVRHELRAGALTALLDGVDLRYVRWGDVDIVRRIYVAVRDLAWDTVLPEIVEREIEIHEDRFAIQLRVRHERGPIVFSWHGTISGSTDGVIIYEMDGCAESPFDYAKIGVYVHHPLSTAGQHYRGSTPGGSVAGRFPVTIAPQIHIGEVDLPLFPPVTELRIDQTSELRVDLSFDGERFEVEDHRNWSDAGFKSYSTPADLGYRFRAKSGELRRDAIRVSVSGRPAPVVLPGESVHVEVDRPLGLHMPRVGLGIGPDASDEDLRLLRFARPSHLRIDLLLETDGWEERLFRTDMEARKVGCAIELALILGAEPEHELSILARLLPIVSEVARVIVLRSCEEVTRPIWIAAARGQLAPLLGDVPFFGGTSGYFAELNRSRECISGADGIAFAVTPQVHAFDVSRSWRMSPLSRRLSLLRANSRVISRSRSRRSRCDHDRSPRTRDSLLPFVPPGQSPASAPSRPRARHQ